MRISISIISVFFFIFASGCNTISEIDLDTSSFDYSHSPCFDTKLIFEDDYSVSEIEAKLFINLHFPNRDYSLSSINEGKDTLLYVFNFDEGWAIVAGDKRFQPIVGEGFTGAIDEDANEEVLCWLQDCAKEVRDFKIYSLEGDNEYSQLWSSIVNSNKKVTSKTKDVEYKWGVFKTTYLDSVAFHDEVPHLLVTKWGQRRDYLSHRTWNYKCPFDKRTGISQYCPTGCTSVAIGQMLYFTHYSIGKPTGLYHTITVSRDTIDSKTRNIGFSRGDYHAYSDRWDSMATRYYEAHTDYVGDLMMDIGNRIGIAYAGNGSSATTSLSCFSYFDLSGSTSSYNSSTVQNCLYSGTPVVVRASDGSTGHAWIIDGIRKKTSYYTEECTFEYSENWMYANEHYDTFDELRVKYHINDPNEPLYLHYTADVNYLLMNWGWNGSYDDDCYSLFGGSWLGLDNGKKIFYDFH